MTGVYCVLFTVERALRKQAVYKTNGILGADAFSWRTGVLRISLFKAEVGMKQENRRGKTLSVVMSATLAATFGVPALAVADEAVSTPAAIEQSVASDGVQQGALAAASTEQKALQVQAEGQGAIKVGRNVLPDLARSRRCRVCWNGFWQDCYPDGQCFWQWCSGQERHGFHA